MPIDPRRIAVAPLPLPGPQFLAGILDALPTKARGHNLMLAQSGDLRRMADVGG